MRAGFILCIAILGLLSSQAAADGRAFPPDNCSEQSPFMAFTAIQNSNTYCTSGQDIFRNALPNCQAGQQIIFDGTNFACQTVISSEEQNSQNALPNCATGESLTQAADGGFGCRSAYPRNCTSRTATAATKIQCGLQSTVYCRSSEYAQSGGMSGGSNLQLQNSSAVLDGTGTPVGWTITAYDSSGSGLCTSNKYTPDGRVASGNPPSFRTDAESMSGAAQATCCPR